MKKPVAWTLAIAAAVAIAAVLYYQSRERALEPQPVPAPPVAVVPAPQPSAEPQIRYPIETEDKPLPPLNESDDAVRDALAGLLGDRSLLDLLNLREFVRRVVATVDNLPRKKLAPRLMPVKPAPGQFVITGKDETLVLSPENYARYAPFVRLLEAVDAKKLVALYARLYPLFQQAYWDLGYPQAYFNDRLVEVIDSLLDAPEVQGPIRLVRPKIYYRFADPELEALPAGQKILIRIGPANAAKAKAKLREIRSELVSKAPDR
jgi:hypothetical protein